ncbi:hypothetical protein DFQ26_003587, partial [Actinomortierella ambigua]
MFSDECSVHRIKPFGTQYCYTNGEHDYRHPYQFKRNMQGGGGRIMSWGCITAHGVGDLCWVEGGNMDAEYYESVLSDYVLSSRDWYSMDPAKVSSSSMTIAAIHTAKR